MDLELSIACSDYGHLRALRDGQVEPEGVRLRWATVAPSELFYRQLRFEEFDVCEMSLANLMTLCARGDERFAATPVFPNRSFRHGFIFVRRAAGIERPQDLRGRRVGVAEYHMTAAVFMRGFLWEDHGVRPEEMRWVVGGINSPALPSRLDVEAAPGVDVVHAPEGTTLNRMLLAGEIDALFGSRAPTAVVEGDPAVGRLFPDYPAVEAEFYRRTGVYPIMHCFVLKRGLLRSHPWLAASLIDAFRRSKEVFLERLEEHSALLLNVPWLDHHLEHVRTLLGRDLWPYGVEANRATLEAAERYLHDQGLLARRLSVDEVFAAGT